MMRRCQRLMSRWCRRCLGGTWLILALAGPCLLPTVAAADSAQVLSLVVGDTQVLDVPGVRRVAVGNGRIASVSAVDSRQLLVLAESAGTTGVRIWQADGSTRELRIEVAAVSGAALLARVRELLAGAAHLQTRLVGEQVLVEGEQVSQSERERLAAVVKALPNQVLDLTERVGWDAMVQMQVSIVELRHTRGESLGLRWLEQVAGPAASITLHSDGTRSAALEWNASLGSALQLLVSRGSARMLAEPALSCRSGGRAHFVSGGEMPVPVLNGTGTPDVQYKEYGIILDIQPSADRQGNVFARVEAEVSDVDTSVQVMGVPGLLKRHSTTEVNVRLGETIVIAGLTRRALSRERQGLPLLGAIPVLGALFRTRSGEWTDSELIVLITPRLIAATGVATEPVTSAGGVARADALRNQQVTP